MVVFLLSLTLASPCLGQSFLWEQTKGPEGGHIHSLLANGTTLFASVEMAGVYRSTDQGKYWDLVHRGGYVSRLFRGPSGQIYLLGDIGFYRSDDDGNTWMAVDSNCPGHTLAFLGNEIFVGGWDGVYKLLDNGNWEQTGSGLVGGVVMYLAVTSGGRLLAGMAGIHDLGNLRGVYYSDDKGVTWVQVNELKDESVTSLAVSPWGTIFVGTRARQVGTGYVQAQIFRSLDNGYSWDSQLPPSETYVVYGFAFGDVYRVFSCGHTVWESLSNGANGSWADLKAAIFVNSVAVDSKGNLFSGNNGMGVRRYIDGKWEPANGGMVATHIKGVALGLSDEVFAGGWVGGVYRTLDRGESWQGLWLARPDLVIENIAVNSKGHIFLGGWFAYSLDGQSWTQTGINGKVAVDHLDNLYLYHNHVETGVRKLTGELSDPSPFTILGLEGKWITAMAISRAGVILAGTYYNHGGLYRSSDFGKNWEQILPEPLCNDHVLAVAVSPNGTIFASTYDSYGIWRSVDGGTFWKKVYDYHTRSLAANAEGQVFAGLGHNGVLFTDDNGDKWEIFGPEHGINRHPWSFTFDESGYAYAGTWGGGVFRTTQPTFKTVAIDIKPGDYPNSLNPNAKGRIPVAVLTVGDFDAGTVAAGTVRFGRKGMEAAPVHSALADADADGDIDLILHFNLTETGIVCGDTLAVLTGKTTAGRSIKGSDSIRTVGCK